MLGLFVVARSLAWLIFFAHSPSRTVLFASRAAIPRGASTRGKIAVTLNNVVGANPLTNSRPFRQQSTNAHGCFGYVCWVGECPVCFVRGEPKLDLLVRLYTSAFEPIGDRPLCLIGLICSLFE